MAGYNMTNGGSGYAFGGGGFGGLGDFGQALYFGLGQAMPMLSAVYDFQDKNALRQDAMNNAASQLRANTMDNTTNALYGLDRNNVIMKYRHMKGNGNFVNMPDSNEPTNFGYAAAPSTNSTFSESQGQAVQRGATYPQVAVQLPQAQSIAGGLVYDGQPLYNGVGGLSIGANAPAQPRPLPNYQLYNYNPNYGGL